MLLKVCLILGVEVHVNVEFVKLTEPPSEQTGDGELRESVCVCSACFTSVQWVQEVTRTDPSLNLIHSY